MSEDWKAALHASLLEWLQKRRADAVRLLSWTESTGSDACDTCGNNWVEIEFLYDASTGRPQSYYHEGSFSDLLRELA